MLHYLDNAATTRVAPPVIQAITAALQDHYANASALYGPGADSEALLEEARETLAGALGCTPREVVFTASGSEGNNIALWGAAFARQNWAKEVVITGYEHASLARPAEMLAKLGYTVRVVPPGPDGLIAPQAVADAVNGATALAAMMQVNNETGAVLDVARTAALIKQKNPRTAVHVDGVQAFLKLPLVLKDTHIDSYAIAGHKIHAPKGVGALYLRRGYTIQPPYLGGKQENGLRPGTENLPYILGLAAAVRLLRPTVGQRFDHVSALNAWLRDEIAARPGLVLNSPPAACCSPYILNLSAPGLRSETVLHFLELSHQVYLSSASACGKGAASRTLRAMGLPAARIDGALRVSLCGDTVKEDLQALLAGLDEALIKLARARR